MSSDRAEPSGGADRFHTVQPLRDLESNWTVDLAKNLEDYLIKICSGDVSNDDPGHFSVNFAEAALLLQGSVQVYSRKVEYLYSLVLHALEFVSQKKQLDQTDDTSAQPEEDGSGAGNSGAVPEAEDDCFWSLDDIPVEAKISLDSSSRKDALVNEFVKPPANLVVLEGDCLDASGDGNELESYLLANSDLYQDFILLDPCDAVAVDDFVKSAKTDQGPSSVYITSPAASKSRKTFQSPVNRSGGSRLKSAEKSQNNINHCPPSVDQRFENNDANIGDGFPSQDACEDMHDVGIDGGFYDPRDLDHSDNEDEDDPWKPLNPHEPGNLRIKPFKKVNAIRRQSIDSSRQIAITSLFPLAKMHGTISSEFNEAWEVRQHAPEGKQQTQSHPLFEKLRQSLVHGGHETYDAFGDHKDAEEDNDGGFDSSPPDFDMPDDTYIYEEVPMDTEKPDDHHGAHFGVDEGFGPEDQNSQGTLEDLCRSHLDSLLASIAESEKQTELATRVSTWKQRIESNLDEQDSRPPFDIHKYGQRVLDKLSSEAGTESAMSFTDVVSGQEKHDVARTFSALLQLVNNRDVDLERETSGSEPSCYTAVNPFYVRLLKPQPRLKMNFKSPKKAVANKPPMKRGSCTRGKDKPGGTEKHPATTISSPPPSASSPSINLGTTTRCTPESKRRRRSRLVEPIDLPSAG